MSNIIQIKHGSNDPEDGILYENELGYSTGTKRLFIGSSETDQGGRPLVECISDIELLYAVNESTQAIESDIQAIQSNISNIQSEIGNIDELVNKLDSDLATLTQKVDQLAEEELAEVKADISGLNSSMLTIVNNISGLKTSVSTITTDINGLKTSVSNLGENISRNSQDIASNTAKISTNSNLISDLSQGESGIYNYIVELNEVLNKKGIQPPALPW